MRCFFASRARVAFTLLLTAVACLGLAQTVVSVTISPASVVGGATATGTVRLSKATPAVGALVQLSCNAAFVTVPATVTVSPRAKSATFSVSTGPVAATGSSRITAYLNGSSKSTIVSVKPAALTSLILLPPTISDGDDSIGVVSLSGPAPAAGVTVNLRSSSLDAAVPASVAVRGGATSTSFLIVTQPVAKKTISVITAKMGTASKTGSLTIVPATIGSLVLSPSSIVGGDPSIATLSLTGVAPTGGFIVSVSCSNPDVAYAPMAVLVPAGESEVSFAITTGPVSSETSVGITASAKGSGVSADLAIQAERISSISLSPNALIGGGSSTATVTMSAPAPPSGCIVGILTSSVSAKVPPTVTIPSGSRSTTFTVDTLAVDAITPVTVTAALGGQTESAGLTLAASNILADSVWPKFHGNAQNTGLGVASDGAGKLQWRFQTGWIIGASSPAVGADGTVYVGSWDDNIYALNPDGSPKWQVPTGNFIFCSPSIGSDGTVYVSSTDGYVYAVNPDGTIKWRFESGGFGNSSPALAPDGTIYIGAYDNNLYAITSTGNLKWKFNIGQSCDSSPAIGPDGTIYVGSDDDLLYALTPGGTLKWVYVTGNVVTSAPAIGADGTIYIGCQDNNVYAIDVKGNLKWSYPTGNQIWSSPCIGPDGTIYVGSTDNNLYALTPQGALRWKYATGAKILNSSPSVGADGTIYVGSRDNYLYAINSSGSLKWSFATGSWIDSSPAIGPNGTIYVGSNDHYVYAIH